MVFLVIDVFMYLDKLHYEVDFILGLEFFDQFTYVGMVAQLHNFYFIFYHVLFAFKFLLVNNLHGVIIRSITQLALLHDGEVTITCQNGNQCIRLQYVPIDYQYPHHPAAKL